MRTVERKIQVGRRDFLRTVTLAVPAAALASSGAIGGVRYAWAGTAESLQPKTAATLARVARDIYPHDFVPERFYVTAVESLDKKAKADPAVQTLLENGVAGLDAQATAAHRRPYIALEDEEIRLGFLKAAADSPFFTTVRSDLVVSLYNQPELWALFGYEGSSFEHGGYIHRGFDDVDWLPKA